MFVAENVAKACQISREQQDEYALQSQRRADEAQKAGNFRDEIVTVIVKDRKGDLSIDQDEFPRSDTSLDSLAKLRPAFTSVGNLQLSIHLSVALHIFFCLSIFLFRMVQ